jgi:hypothetical protein
MARIAYVPIAHSGSFWKCCVYSLWGSEKDYGLRWKNLGSKEK